MNKEKLIRVVFLTPSIHRALRCRVLSHKGAFIVCERISNVSGSVASQHKIILKKSDFGYTYNIEIL